MYGFFFSDASKTGWGAACGKDRANGKWSKNEKTLHINYLEILAAYFGLMVFAKNLRDCQILLRIDNTTAISYINKMGGVRFPHLTDITRLNKKCEKYVSWHRDPGAIAINSFTLNWTKLNFYAFLPISVIVKMV